MTDKRLVQGRPSFESLTLTALRLELSETILGGAIQKVAVDGSRVLLEIYAHHARRQLLCHVGDDAARIHLTTSRVSPSALKETPLLLHLRKQLRGGRITAIVQPPHERVLRLEIARREGGVERRRGLIIETMGRRSNAILVDEHDVIIEAARRTPPSRNPRRPILPSLPYVPPPAQDRVIPEDTGAADLLAARARDHDPREPLAKLLGDEVAGLSGLAAREAAHRYAGSSTATIDSVDDWGRVIGAVRELAPGETHSGAWIASVDGSPVALTAYEPTALRGVTGVTVERVASVSNAIERAFSIDVPRRRGGLLAQAILSRINSEIERERRREGALCRELEQAGDADQLRQFGEAVLASLASIRSGANELEFAGLRVPLDPALTPLEMSEKYFSEYRKARDAQARVPEMLIESRQRLEFLDTLVTMVETADSSSSYRQIERDLNTLGNGEEQKRDAKPSKQKQAEAGPRRFHSPDGVEILVGTSATVNGRLTFKLAGPRDIWMHAHGLPGAHVVLRAQGRDPSAESLQAAADLAARFSSARGSTTVPVIYTEARHVRKISGAPPGLVRYVQERSLTGRPDRAEALITVSR